MDIFLSYLEFLLRAFTVFFLIAILLLISKKKKPTTEQIQFKSMNSELRDKKLTAAKTILGKKFKSFAKIEATKRKQEASNILDRVFVIDFKGDIMAKGVTELREQITLILSLANSTDEVVIRLSSPGGTVSGYGLCAAQLTRVRNQGLTLTVCVDEVAASGGYMMAATGSKILAAPFAIIGSIGVVLETVNLNKLLKNHDIDYEQITAGKFKRTVSKLGEITPSSREKAKEDITKIHEQFKSLIKKFRPTLSIDEVATGEIWSAETALEHGLVDALSTSDEYLCEMVNKKNVYLVQSSKKKTFAQKLGFSVRSIMDELTDYISNRGTQL